MERVNEAGTFIGLNPKGWGPLTLQPCQCRLCVRIRAFGAGRQSVSTHQQKETS